MCGAVVVAAGCAGVQHFDATERATASSPEGDVAAEYEVAGASGPLAEVRVWTGGAYESRVDGREMTMIEAVLDVSNEGSAPIVLSEVTLRSLRVSGVSLGHVRPVRITGEREVPPGGRSRVRAYFAIPQRYDPEDVGRFDIAWQLRHAEGTYAQRTPFHQPPRERFAGSYGYPYPYPAPFAYMPPDATMMSPP